MIVRRLARWFDDRLRASSFAHHALNKVFPDDWSFMLGEIALYSFVILVLTGTFLTFFFTPSSKEIVYQGSYAPLRGTRMSEAYASVLKISFDVLEGAKPIAGPATRPLPQLPLEVGADGFLRAQGDYAEPVGPGFWNEGS